VSDRAVAFASLTVWAKMLSHSHFAEPVGQIFTDLTVQCVGGDACRLLSSHLVAGFSVLAGHWVIMYNYLFIFWTIIKCFLILHISCQKFSSTYLTLFDLCLSLVLPSVVWSLMCFFDLLEALSDPLKCLEGLGFRVCMTITVCITMWYLMLM
jgi:hypothetical protein